jgi:secreted Zn-dependent insulinase-like peptidase
MSPVEVLETPDKSENDKKEYRLFRINQNKLTVLVISHAKLSEEDLLKKLSDESKSGERLAAAAMCVDVGSFHDIQTGVKGMAHFVEHMVILKFTYIGS